MRKKSSPLITLLFALTMAACGGESQKGSPGEEACAVGSRLTETRLFFGFGRKNAPPVSPEEWQDFLDKEVTPRFKEGLTVIDADGQYLGMAGDLTKEDSRILILLHDGSEASSKAIDAIRDTYNTRFDQEAVLRIDQEVCAAF
jgi:hypothetical protein